jgi:hypothetical protein
VIREIKKMSTRIEFIEYDGVIHLGADPTKGIWANQTLLRGSRTIRTGGQLPTEASAHTLHVVALTTALRDITKGQAINLVNRAATIIGKPRIVVVVTDPTFADALTAKIQGQQGKPLRAGKNFLVELARQLARFTVTFQTDPGNTSSYSLRHWAKKSVHDPKAVQRIPQALAATVASAVS